MSGDVRASDAERKAVVDELTRHCGEGRLTMSEAEERIAAAWGARTIGELRTLLEDLPRPTPARQAAGVPVPDAVRPAPGRSLARRSFDVHVRVYVLVIAFLCLIWLLTGAGYFWPVWPALGWGLAVGIHGAGTR